MRSSRKRRGGRFKRGDRVETTTGSGETILCTVLESVGREWLLASPSHGYAIQRHPSEMRLVSREED
jgi:hypothetical protein